MIPRSEDRATLSISQARSNTWEGVRKTVSASSTPLSSVCGRKDKEEFCSPYMNMRGTGNPIFFDIKSALPAKSTID